MGKYVAFDDPIVDETVASHMQRISAAIRARMQPEAIVLRGSFGRGEGSVLIEQAKLTFLSDYEINVVTASPGYRSLFRTLSEQLTTELGVSTGIAWMHPDYFRKNRIAMFSMGPAPVSICLYETRYGSQILYGRDVLHAAPPIDVSEIPLTSGLSLLLNRMAESLPCLPQAEDDRPDDWQSVYWLNKLVLACVESLLLAWGQYHYSYRERGNRFRTLATERLEFLGKDAFTLAELGERATRFKLQPQRDLYPDSLHATWLQVVSICDSVFRHLAARVLGSEVDACYTDYSSRYLQHEACRHQSSPTQHVLYKALDVYKFGRKGRIVPNLLSRNITSQVIYSVVPLLFAAWSRPDATASSMLDQARRQMATVSSARPVAKTPTEDWRALSRDVFSMWMNFCY
jgi:hypothetical protein